MNFIMVCKIMKLKKKYIMERRNFIKLTSASSAFIATQGLYSCINNKINAIENNEIDPIIPMRIFPKYEKEIVSQIIELRKKYGFRRFLILGPDKTVRFSGFPEPEVYSKIGNLILKLKEELKQFDIEIGWECSATIKQGPRAFYQNLIGIDGRISEISFCPLDPGFREVLTENILTVVSIANPFMVAIEDDFTLSHAGALGCFCKFHLAEFAKRQEHYYSREELIKIFSEVTPESVNLRRAWAELGRDSLSSLADFIRQKIDNIHPETRILLCQPGAADILGDLTENLTKAFAGKTKPAVRLFGTDYGSDNAVSLPQTIFNALYGSQHLPDNFELYHESDTFPHTRFFMSSAKIKSLMTAAFAYGIDDSRFHPVQNTDNTLEDTGYSRMYKNEVARFGALKAAVENCNVTGCEIMYDPFEHITNAYGGGGIRRYAWANVTGRLGIPHTSVGGKVKMVSGNTVNLMTDDEVIKLLGGSVFLDGKAADILYKRGFKELIGTEVLPGKQPEFLYEGIRNISDFHDITGDMMYNFLIFQIATEGGSFVELHPLENAKVLTDFLDGKQEPVTPGMIRYENKLGGRVAITAYDLNNNSSSAIINYKKKEIMKQTIEWLGNEPLPIFVKYEPNVFCIFNCSQSKDYANAVIISLCSDPLDSITLEVAPEWLNSQFSILNSNGTWDKIDVEKQGYQLKFKTNVALMNPVIFSFNKK
jgi:hypothetical protein